jgi:hypothetical protein
MHDDGCTLLDPESLASIAGNSKLSDSDLEALMELERSLAVVRDRVRGVAHRHHNGFFLCGPPGTSKTFTVKQTLRSTGVPFHYVQGHLTPMGLFEVFKEHRDQVIVLDDVAEMLAQTTALQLLLAALGNQPGETDGRVLCYKRLWREDRVYFTGGLICLSNMVLLRGALLQALKSRVHYLVYDPTDGQLAALMRFLASQGWPRQEPKLTPDECAEVAEHLITECKRLSCRLDIRLLVEKAFPDYLQCRNGEAETDWRDLVTTTVHEAIRDLTRSSVSQGMRKEEMEFELRIVREILAEFQEPEQRLAAWRERTGGRKSDRAFYRRWEQLKAVPGL